MSKCQEKTYPEFVKECKKSSEDYPISKHVQKMVVDFFFECFELRNLTTLTLNLHFKVVQAESSFE